MAAKIARMHFLPANRIGASRAVLGWAVAVGGLILLSVQLGNGLPSLQGPLRDALLGGAMAAVATTLGALPVLVMRNIGASVQGLLLGFGAGVMLAASVFSLLMPGFEAAQALGVSEHGAALIMAGGLAIGAALLLLMDRALPHTHAPDRSRPFNAVWLFVFAIAVHNIPEGLAIGVAAGEPGSGNAVATGISLQNVPEGLIVAIALVSAGYGRLFSVAIAALSGLVEPMSAVVGQLLVGVAEVVLPWGLAGAAGAMLFVVSHEIIPESHRRGHETLATGGLMAGFVLMMLLDVMLG